MVKEGYRCALLTILTLHQRNHKCKLSYQQKRPPGGINYRTLVRAVKAGTIPTVKLVARPMISVAVLDEFVKRMNGK